MTADRLLALPFLARSSLGFAFGFQTRNNGLDVCSGFSPHTLTIPHQIVLISATFPQAKWANTGDLPSTFGSLGLKRVVESSVPFHIIFAQPVSYSKVANSMGVLVSSPMLHQRTTLMANRSDRAGNQASRRTRLGPKLAAEPGWGQINPGLGTKLAPNKSGQTAFKYPIFWRSPGRKKQDRGRSRQAAVSRSSSRFWGVPSRPTPGSDPSALGQTYARFQIDFKGALAGGWVPEGSGPGKA
jgi:hypothetical protein